MLCYICILSEMSRNCQVPLFFLLSYAVPSNFKNKSRAYWAKSYICGSTKVQWTYVIFCSGFEPITFWFKGNAILYMYIVRDVTELPKHQNVRYQATKLQNLKENNGSFYSYTSRVIIHIAQTLTGKWADDLIFVVFCFGLNDT